ncbi:MAG: hypothetical protein MMC23_005070 [Stictis urceolatum]|nr:hypothetical protein [Stictis urceolata]
MRFPVFRVFYSTTFTVLTLLTFALLLISPGDGIFQSYVNNQLWNVVIIAGTYLLTLITAAFIYATRIYTTRQHLASIPRSYLPIRKGDASKYVRQLIADGLARSATIAYNAHPRDLKENENSTPAEAEVLGASIKSLSAVPSSPPPWGKVAHPGWSSPSSSDLPSVHYEPVLLELPHLIEAKAVSLAPQDLLTVPTPPATPTNQGVILPDPVAVSILQRPAALNLRDYLAHLSSLAMLSDPELQTSFLTQYERARFSTLALSEPEFRALMGTFSTLLRSLAPPDPSLLAAAAADSSSILSAFDSPSQPASIRSFSQASLVLERFDSLNPSTAMGPATQAQAQAHTPFSTPHPGYAASVSSNDGDRDDSGSERSAHTAWTRLTRPSQRAGIRSASRYTAGTTGTVGTFGTAGSGWTVGEEGYGTPVGERAVSEEGVQERDGGGAEDFGDLESDAGSVIRRVLTGATGSSGLSGESVVVRREGREELNLPVVDGIGEGGLGIS